MANRVSIASSWGRTTKRGRALTYAEIHRRLCWRSSRAGNSKITGNQECTNHHSINGQFSWFAAAQAGGYGYVQLLPTSSLLKINLLLTNPNFPNAFSQWECYAVHSPYQETSWWRQYCISLRAFAQVSTLKGRNLSGKAPEIQKISSSVSPHIIVLEEPRPTPWLIDPETHSFVYTATRRASGKCFRGVHIYHGKFLFFQLTHHPQLRLLLCWWPSPEGLKSQCEMHSTAPQPDIWSVIVTPSQLGSGGTRPLQPSFSNRRFFSERWSLKRRWTCLPSWVICRVCSID